MASNLRTRLASFVDAILGREPTGQAAPPHTGIDPASKRHFTALIVGTLVIMTFGIIVAIVEDGPNTTTATPTVVATPSPAGARLTSGPSVAIAT
jgi:hypothetical protein